MATPRGFAASMRRLGTNIVRNALAGQRATALAVDQAVVISTPVDTGRARSNWIVQSGSPSRSTRQAYSPNKAGVSGSANASAAIAQGRGVIDKHVEGPIYISNNLDYIGKLNDGSSVQAPAGFVEIAVRAGVEVVKKIRLLANR